MFKISKGQTRELKNGFDYEPIVIETKNHRFEQSPKGYFYQLTTGTVLGAASAMLLLVLVMCL